MVASLLKEDSNSGTSCLEQLAELVHCMVFRFPGFPDLYEPVMEAIKVSDNPPLLLHSTLTRTSLCALLRAILQVGGSPHQLVLAYRAPRWVIFSQDCSEPICMTFSLTINPSFFLKSSYISFKALLRC